MDRYRQFRAGFGAKAHVAVPGRADQIAARGYADFEMRIVAANGVVWTGKGNAARSVFPRGWEGLPKNLRDDDTAFNLANIGYLMLHTTALALGDQEVADLGRQHFRDYADAILRFDSLVPASVVRYLQQEGLPATDVVSQVNRTVKEAWDQVEEAPASERFTQSQR